MSTEPSQAARQLFEKFDFDAIHADIAKLRKMPIFFIGGSPKSGTTWVQVLLGAHPQISCRGESHFPDQLGLILARAAEQYNDVIRAKNRLVFGEFGGAPMIGHEHHLYMLGSTIALLLREWRPAETVRILGEKTPNNVVYFPLLQAIFPQAKFIHVVRDGRDCTVSCWFHNLRANRVETLRTYPTFVDFAAKFAEVWKTHVIAGTQFANANPTVTYLVRYEDLSVQPADTLRKLLGFLDVSAGEQEIAQCLADGAFQKLSGGRKPGEEDSTAFFRKGQVGDWKKHFTPAMQAKFETDVGAQLRLFGYL